MPVCRPVNTLSSNINVSPAAKLNRKVRDVSGSFTSTGIISCFVNCLPSGVVRLTLILCTPILVAFIGTEMPVFCKSPNIISVGIAEVSTVTPWPITSSPMRPLGPVAWVISSNMRLESPGARKRGKLAVITTGSRTRTSCSALPTPDADQTTAITRTVPLNSGRSKLAWAIPSVPTVIGPEK